LVSDPTRTNPIGAEYRQDSIHHLQVGNVVKFSSECIRLTQQEHERQAELEQLDVPSQRPILRRFGSISAKLSAESVQKDFIIRHIPSGETQTAEEFFGEFCSSVQLFDSSDVRLTTIIPKFEYRVCRDIQSTSKRLGVDSSDQPLRCFQLECDSFSEYRLVKDMKDYPITTRLSLLVPLDHQKPLITQDRFLKARPGQDLAWLANSHRYYQKVTALISPTITRQPTREETLETRANIMGMVKYMLSNQEDGIDSKSVTPGDLEMITLFKQIKGMPEELSVLIISYLF
tara:strand:- start:825 stop:1688 length:864 start_codon:yes stop_codon:yes gene_type:complete